jgi:hypothetical protein
MVSPRRESFWCRVAVAQSDDAAAGFFLCLITPLCSYLYRGLYGGLYGRAHVIRSFPQVIRDQPADAISLKLGINMMARLRRGSSAILPPHSHFIWRFPIRGTNCSDE